MQTRNNAFLKLRIEDSFEILKSWNFKSVGICTHAMERSDGSRCITVAATSVGPKLANSALLAQMNFSRAFMSEFFRFNCLSSYGNRDT